MDQRVESMFDMSNDNKEGFNFQEETCDYPASIYIETDSLRNATFEEIQLEAELLSKLIFAVPGRNGNIGFIDKSSQRMGKVLLAFVSKTSAEEFEKNYNTSLVYITFDDLTYIMDNYGVDWVTVYFNKKEIDFSKQTINYLLNCILYNNYNPNSLYMFCEQDADFLDEIKQKICDKLSKYKSIKNIWLYALSEQNNPDAGDTTEREALYNTFVIDMNPYDFLFIKDYIEMISYRTIGDQLKVILKDSKLGQHLFENPETHFAPFFSNEQ